MKLPKVVVVKRLLICLLYLYIYRNLFHYIKKKVAKSTTSANIIVMQPALYCLYVIEYNYYLGCDMVKSVITINL